MISEFPLLVFTLLAGMSSGAYVAAAAFPPKQDQKRLWLFPVLTLVLLAVAGICVMGHLGRPDRVFNAFGNPMTSGISQEGILSAVLAVVMIVDAGAAIARKKRIRAVSIVGAIAAVLLACAMSNAYYASYAILAFHSVGTWIMFIAGNIAMGFALYGVLEKGTCEIASFRWALVALAAVAGLGLCVLAAHFAGSGVNAGLLVAGLIIGPIAAIILLLVGKKVPPCITAWVVLILLFVGMGIVRDGFYAAIAL